MYRLHSLVQLLQQLITVYRPATQPCTVTPTIGYSVPTGYRLHSLVQLFQQMVTECTDWVLATHSSLNSLLHTSWLQSLPAYYQPSPSSKVFYQLDIPHEQPIHRPKTDDRPNNV